MSSDSLQPFRLASAAPIPDPLLPSDSAESLKAALCDVQQELIACQRLAMMGSQAAMIAHEFNNLMTPVVARCDAALKMDDIPFMRKTVERSLTLSQRAIALSQHLLDAARNNGRPDGVCSAARAVREAVATTARPFEKDGIELRVAVSEELHVAAREDLLCQVILNLLLNARQAMKGLTGTLAITAAMDGDQITIDVKDSGKGLPRDMRDDRLNAFLATDPSARPNDWQEVGLGLSVCRLIAHQHGATIRASTNPDRGCTFHVRWPAAKPLSPTLQSVRSGRTGDC